MRFNHSDLSVPEVAQPQAFFEKYFGLPRIVPVSRDDQEVAVLSAAQGRRLRPRVARGFHGAWTYFFRAPGGFDIDVLHQYRCGDDVGGVRSTPTPGGSARLDIA